MKRIMVVLGFVVASGAGALWASDWAQWRGPMRTGYVPGGEVVPRTLPGSPPVVWHFGIGEGVASPVVSGGRVFYLDAQEGKEVVHAVEAGSGKEVWKVALDELHKD